MLKGDALEPQSWLRCPLTCVGQDATPNSNLAGAILILYLNLLTHVHTIMLLFTFPLFPPKSVILLNLVMSILIIELGSDHLILYKASTSATDSSIHACSVDRMRALHSRHNILSV